MASSAETLLRSGSNNSSNSAGTFSSNPSYHSSAYCAVLCCAGCTVDDVHITIGHRPCLVMDGCQLNLNLLLLLPFAHVYPKTKSSSSSSSSSFSRKTKKPIRCSNERSFPIIITPIFSPLPSLPFPPSPSHSNQINKVIAITN